MRRYHLVVVAVLTGLLAACKPAEFPRNGSVNSDLAVVRTKVFTSNTQQPWAEAVAVKDGKIVYVGDNEGVKDFLGADTRIIDADGGMVTPGFVDSHTHAVWLGMLNAVMASLHSATSMYEITVAVKDFAVQHSDLPFVMGYGWKSGYVPSGVSMVEQADAVLSDRPLILWSDDAQTGWVNSAALGQLQAANQSAFDRLSPEYGTDGRPTGLLLDFEAFNPFDFFPLEELGPDVVDKMSDALKAMFEEGLSLGVTAHHDVMIHRRVPRLLIAMRDRGAFERARARCALFVDQGALEDEVGLLADLAQWKEYAEQSTPHLVMGDAVALAMDGVPQNRTSMVYEEYADVPGNFGSARWIQEDFNRITSILDGEHFQICTQATGDAGIDRVLNGYEALAGKAEYWDARHTIEHCSLVLPDGMERMAKLGVCASMQPAHHFSDGAIEEALGLERLKRQYPCASLGDAGVNVAFGSDFSILPMNPVYGLLVAATRLNYHWELNWGPEEAVSVVDAIRHYTIDSARILKMEQDIGSIEVGKSGDLVLFDTDLRDIKQLFFLMTGMIQGRDLSTMVVLTAVDGKIMYTREGSGLK